MIWWTVLAASLGCYLLKYAGLAVPESVLARPIVARLAELIPVALLAALVIVQVFAATAPDPDGGSGGGSGGQMLQVDARVAGLACAAVLLWKRAPFLVVVVASAAVAAALRAV